MYLACVYGYQQRFDEMMTTIDKAINLDGAIQEHFQEPLRLVALLHACGSDQIKIEQVGKEIDVPPVTKEMFGDSIKTPEVKNYQEYLQNYHGWLKWIAVKRPHASGESGIYLIKIAPQNSGDVVARSQTIEGGKLELIPFMNSIVSVEDLYDALVRSFILFYPVPKGYPYL
jgi:hypothetical protein